MYAHGIAPIPDAVAAAASAGRHFEAMSLRDFRDRLRTFRWTRRIDAVHMHHTDRPRKADYEGEKTIIGMWRYHTQTNGWSDIAQHVSIAPDGVIWTGRDWNAPPASDVGDNGTGQRGPFMFETIGDFDVGQDTLDGAQLESVYGVIVAVEDHFGLATASLRFHRQLGSPKSCPGSSIDYEQFLERVRAYRLGRKGVA